MCNHSFHAKIYEEIYCWQYVLKLPLVQGIMLQKSLAWMLVMFLFSESPVCTLFIVVEEDDSEWLVMLLCNL